MLNEIQLVWLGHFCTLGVRLKLACNPQLQANPSPILVSSCAMKQEKLPQFSRLHRVHCSFKLSPVQHNFLPQSAWSAPTCVLSLQHALYEHKRRVLHAFYFQAACLLMCADCRCCVKVFNFCLSFSSQPASPRYQGTKFKLYKYFSSLETNPQIPR